MEPQKQQNNNGQRPNNKRPQRGSRPQGQGNGRPQNRGGKPAGNGQQNQLGGNLTVSRGQAVRAQKRTQMDAQKIANQYQQAQERGRANVIKEDTAKLKITFLGGQEAIGEKNMQVLEFGNDALILDCGNHLGVD